MELYDRLVLTRRFGPSASPFRTRAFDMGPLLDILMVCAVGTILIIRTQLWLTNYPQLGGHGLHIAHMLWGGLGMLIAIVLLVSFLSPVVRRVGAILGGIGLGFFIDELGKFLTSDNNYFFKPTAAIIYIFFIVFYLIARGLQRRRDPTPQEYLVNALELAKDAATDEMDEEERQRALAYVARADQTDPAVAPMRALLERVRVRPAIDPSFAQRFVVGARDRYYRLTQNRWFIRIVTLFFVLWGLVTVVEIIGLIFTLEPHLHEQQELVIKTPVTSKSGHYGFVEWANIAFSIISGLFVIWGVARLRRSRLAAYAMFERALFISLFFTQVFVFIQSQFGACTGFLIDLLLLITVRFMAGRERELEAEAVEPGKREPAHASPVPA
jgi:hypothetical protein